HVHERPRISAIEFTGNKKRESSELEKKLFLKPGEVYNPITVRNQVDTLVVFYHDQGFPLAAIDAETDTTKDQGQVSLRFVVREGEKVRITSIRFEGVTAFKEKKLRKQLKTKPKGFFGGGEPKDESFV